MNFIIILLLFTFISKSYNMKAELGGRVKIVCNVSEDLEYSNEELTFNFSVCYRLPLQLMNVLL